MIKYLGTIGTFVRLNDNDDKTYQLLNVYSSSAANLSLFSAEVNNSTGLVIFDSASTSLYINGISGSVIPSQQWTHITFSFDDKLATYDTNNFLIRFGDTASSNFNIQNLYILEDFFTESDVGYLHEEFTGGTSNKLVIPPSASYSINIIDYPEDDYISASTRAIYQPFLGYDRYLMDIAACTEDSLSKFVSSSVMVNDDLFIDTININVGDKVLSLQDNQIYQLNESSQLDLVSSSNGDIVKVLFGQYNADASFIKTNNVFTAVPLRVKIRAYLNTVQINNT